MQLNLAGGSLFREGLANNVLTGLEVRSYDGLATIDGSDLVTDWTEHATLPNVWEKAGWSHDASGTNRLTIYKAGAVLERIEGVAADLDANGQFVDRQGSDSSPWTLQIYSDTDPNLDVYEASKRNSVVWLGDDAVVEDLITQRAIGNNGSLEVGDNATVSRVLAADGTKHNLLIGSGSLTDVVLCRADGLTSYEAANSYLVGYADSHAGKVFSRTRVFASPDAGVTIKDATYTQHSGDFTSPVTSTDEQLGTFNMRGGFGAAAELVTVRGNYLRNAVSLGYFADDATIDYLLWPTTDISDNGALSLNGIGTPGSIKIRHGIFDLSAGSGFWLIYSSSLDGWTVEFENCIFKLAASGSAIMNNSTWASGALKVNNCIFVTPKGGKSIHVPAGVTYTGNNNVFMLDDTFGQMITNWHGSQLTSLAAWKAASGQDADSIVLDDTDLATLFAGTVSNGDWRLGASGAGLLAAALLAGPQSHWDWNTRAIAAGPPTAYPDVPETLAESETYVSDPGAWDFYP